MTTNTKPLKYLEIIALSLCGLLFLTLFVIKQNEITAFKSIIGGLLFGLIAAILLYYAYSSKSTEFAITISLTSLDFIAGIMKALHTKGSELVLMLGTFFLILAIPILTILILKRYVKNPNKNKFHLFLLRILTAYIIVIALLHPILGYLSIHIHFIFNLPIIFMLSFLILQDDFPSYHPSIKNGLKTLLVLYVTLFCLSVITI